MVVFLTGAPMAFLAGLEEPKPDRRYEDEEEEPKISPPTPMEHPPGGEDCPAATLKIQTGRQRKTAPGGLFCRLVYRINIRREVC